MGTELYGEHLGRTGQAQAVMAAGSKGMSRTNLAKKAFEDIELARKASELYDEAKEKERLLEDSKGLAGLFTALVDEGFYDKSKQPVEKQ